MYDCELVNRDAELGRLRCPLRLLQLNIYVRKRFAGNTGTRYGQPMAANFPFPVHIVLS